MMKKADNPQGKELGFTPLTLEEIHEATEKRIEKIQKEFRDGFELIENSPASVTFFGSARLSENHPSYKTTRNLAHRIVNELKYSVLTGGGAGIMEAANRGAFEAGGKSLGLNIKLPQEQTLNSYVTDQATFHYFFSRKVCLSFSAEAYVFFPGGFGTLDELFEILTMVQTKKIERVPIILVGKQFWKHFDRLIRKMLVNKKFIDIEDRELYIITDNLDEVVDIIKEAPVRNGIRFRGN